MPRIQFPYCVLRRNKFTWEGILFTFKHVRASSGIKTSSVLRVEVFWVVTQCSVVVGYQRFGGPCFLHLQG